MNEHDLQKLGFRRTATGEYEKVRAGSNAESVRTVAKLEYPTCNAPLETHKGQKANANRVHIRFTSVRKRLCDPDNLSEKWLLDCLRYCKAIDGDEPEKIALETTQRKAARGESEHTLIEIYD